ncbi:hypothetical protein MLD38_040600 [Melastoma candidum]|nr:hypothetical protein MLD38_040600 [Melastoma candidum]
MSSVSDYLTTPDTHHVFPSSAKRKLDDYSPATPLATTPNDDEGAQFPFVPDFLSFHMRSSDGCKLVVAGSASSSSSRPLLQFFVRMMSEGKTMVFHAHPADTVRSVHERIFAMIGIPVSEQRLIYRGKQLQWEQSLLDCGVQNDASLQLVGRMRSTDHPQAWQIVNDMISTICRLCKGESLSGADKIIQTRISEFVSMTPKDDKDNAPGHINIFTYSSAPAALVMLYMSSVKENRDWADEAIRHFLDSCRSGPPKFVQPLFVPIVLEFCRLLRQISCEDPLYLFCRGNLGSLLEVIGSIAGGSGGGLNPGLRNWKYGENIWKTVPIQATFPFVGELADRLSKTLEASPFELGVSALSAFGSDVHDFKMFLMPLQNAMVQQGMFDRPISLPLQKKKRPETWALAHGVELLHRIFLDLLSKMEKCLGQFEEHMAQKVWADNDFTSAGQYGHLALLKELNTIAKFYQGAEASFWASLCLRKCMLCNLIVRYAKRSDDNQWLLEHKDATNFEARRHLVMMLFPETKEDFEEQHEMLIDRSHILSESFEYISQAESNSLHSGMFMEFKNEEATGPGVLREWFVLVFQAIFNEENALFLSCPNDQRRFYPNPASKVDPLHLKYFKFSGRMMALAMMRKVQIGIVLDRVFFLQLAGIQVTLEDIRDADPFLYSSCRQILEMDAEFIDSDALGLTFVTEIEELRLREVIELCPEGKSTVVNSKNRSTYVSLLIAHKFVTSISEQVHHFGEGFSDILSNSVDAKLFFRSLEHEDLDRMLYGSESDISVSDWKAHTQYNGYKEDDPQIVWFWKILSEMSSQQRKTLLFFWTSVKYLPVEGFGGLASHLSIYKTYEPTSHLPSSHTCFFRLCFPPYHSLAEMWDRLKLIAQEHIGCSFGTW